MTIYADSSMTPALQMIETRFELDHPTIDLELIFAGSQTLTITSIINIHGIKDAIAHSTRIIIAHHDVPAGQYTRDGALKTRRAEDLAEGVDGNTHHRMAVDLFDLFVSPKPR